MREARSLNLRTFVYMSTKYPPLSSPLLSHLNNHHIINNHLTVSLSPVACTHTWQSSVRRHKFRTTLRPSLWAAELGRWGLVGQLHTKKKELTQGNTNSYCEGIKSKNKSSQKVNGISMILFWDQMQTPTWNLNDGPRCGPRRAETEIRAGQVRHWSLLCKLHKGTGLFSPFSLAPLASDLKCQHGNLPIILNLNGEKFGSLVRPELVGKYGQSHPLIFHFFPVSKLIVNFHYSGAGHLKFSFFVHTLDICSPLPLSQLKHGKKERAKSKSVRIWLGRKARETI